MYFDANEKCAIYDESSPSTALTADTSYVTSSDGGVDGTDPCGYYIELQFVSGDGDSSTWFFYINQATNKAGGTAVALMIIMIIYLLY